MSASVDATFAESRHAVGDVGGESAVVASDRYSLPGSVSKAFVRRRAGPLGRSIEEDQRVGEQKINTAGAFDI